eukprot:1078316_1
MGSWHCVYRSNTISSLFPLCIHPNDRLNIEYVCFECKCRDHVNVPFDFNESFDILPLSQNSISFTSSISIIPWCFVALLSPSISFFFWYLFVCLNLHSV